MIQSLEQPDASLHTANGRKHTLLISSIHLSHTMWVHTHTYKHTAGMTSLFFPLPATEKGAVYTHTAILL